LHESFVFDKSKDNVIVIRNQLGSGIILQHHCRCNINNEDRGIRKLEFNGNYTINFKDSGDKRTTWNCVLSYGPKMEYFFDVEVYRAARTNRERQLREWAARTDGIYTRRNSNKPFGP
ncbi:hypothetical protein EUTSA_v10023818mg, partial [Eutrema salsugineum]